jgi:protein-L-isoaspartate O-methyltransferase/anti-sigma regulatory factor (Ser/Thr protein kinase)
VQISDRAVTSLLATDKAAAAARRLVRTWLPLFGLPEGTDITRVQESAELIVSELVTNAVRHSVGQRVTLTMWRHGVHLFAEVQHEDKGNGGHPVVSTPDPLAESGRGLYLVSAYATNVGTHRSDDGRGCVVWASMFLPGADTSGASETLHVRLAEGLAQAQILGQPWVTAFGRVSRPHYVPTVMELGSNGRWEELREGDPRWLPSTWADTVAVTALDTASNPATWVQSPTWLLSALEGLSLSGSERVLHIGTGSGYTVALLCSRLAQHQVTTVESDRATAQRALDRLTASGYHPNMMVGDGTVPVPGAPPVDRILSTAPLARIPRPLLHHLVPGGVLVMPLHVGLGGRALLRIEAFGADGATGRVLATDTGDPEGFPWNEGPPMLGGATHDATMSPAVLDHPAAAFAIGALLPSISRLPYSGGVALIDRVTGAWAVWERGTVRHMGPSPWLRVEAAARAWRTAGSPGPDQWEIRVNSAGCHLSAPGWQAPLPIGF